MPRRAISPESVYSVSSGGESDYAPEPESTTKPAKRARLSGPSRPTTLLKKNVSLGRGGDIDIEDVGNYISRLHDSRYHHVGDIAKLQPDLLEWFESVREKRGMPWRKRYDPSLSMDDKGQRAYEIWVSEVMLQQTQVTTVIAYWKRWIEKWPTIGDLAKADIEEVNAAWRGLGYYRRAKSLLEGAKTVMGDAKYKGRLPHEPEVLEKEISGVGRYTAGAICSMAYGVSTPIIDGNIHRLFTRLMAVHAPQTAPQTIKFLWSAAEELVESLPKDGKKGIAGDWNQALMELGSQVCKPVGPSCSECPLRVGCKAYAETKTPLTSEASGSDACSLCAPIPASSARETIPTVTIFPMKKEKKISRTEDEVVCVTEWVHDGKRSWLFVKRPEKGLLAGLFEPPTTPIPPSSTKESRSEAALKSIAQLLDGPISDDIKLHRDVGPIPHIFSHINMTYHIQHLRLESTSPPPDPRIDRAVWLDDENVDHANVGTGVKKVWAEIFGSWGNFEPGLVGVKKAKSGKRKSEPVKVEAVKKEAKVKSENNGGKVVKKIMMPMMPSRTTHDTK